MKTKKLLVTLILLFVGSISAFSLTNNSPGDDNPEGETGTTPDLTALQAAYNNITDSIKPECLNHEFYAAVAQTTIYSAIKDTLANTNHTAAQDFIDNMLLQLKREINKAPFSYVLNNIQTWYQTYYGPKSSSDYTAAAYEEIFNNSDFGALKIKADSIINIKYIGEEDKIPVIEIYGEPDSIGEGGIRIPGQTGIIRQCTECRSNVTKSFDNKKLILKDLLERIEKNSEYDNIKQGLYYTTPKKWYDDAPDFTYETHNFTLIILYINYLNEEISFADLKMGYKESIDYLENTVNNYFTEEERNDSNEDWKGANDAITNFTTLLSNTKIDPKTGKYTFNSNTYSSLSLMQDEMDKEQQVMQMAVNHLDLLLSNLKETLQKQIETAKELYPLLNSSGDYYKKLYDAIEAVQISDEKKILSIYENAIQALTSKYTEVLEYYEGLQTTLKTSIENAEKLNEEYNDGKLTETITKAKIISEKAEATETEILNATKELAKQTTLIFSRYNLKNSRDSLTNYQTLYSDKDDAMKKLLEDSENPSEETINAFIEQIREKLKQTVATWEADTTNLGKQIEASISYYNRWHETREEVEQLKPAYEKAQTVYDENTTIDRRNIVALEGAYAELYDVYVLVGGNSDAFISRENLIKKIAEAEAYYKKYQYNELQRLINLAKSYTNNDTKYLLDQQITNLTVGMENTEKQYKLIVENLTVQIKTTQNKLEERYEIEDIPASYTALVKTVTDSLTIDTQTNETECTNITILQNYYLSLQEVVKLTDEAWLEAVSKLAQAITETRNKQETTYPDKKDLKTAIELAQAKYENITATIYSTISAVDNIRKDLDKALVAVEGVARRNIADLFITAYQNVSRDFEKYGPDDKSLDYSNAKSYLEGKKSLYEELNTGSNDIPYSLDELNQYCDSINTVKSIYKLFCNSASTLELNILSAMEKDSMYYNKKYTPGDNTENILDKAINAAYDALKNSQSKEIIDEHNFALKDSVSVTKLSYERALSALKKSSNMAKAKHKMYYGSTTSESEIMTVYDEAQILIKDAVTFIKSLDDMTVKLDTCYKHAEDSCALKETEIQQIINLSDTLNVLMVDEAFDEIIAEAINARYSNDGRIAAINTQLKSLQTEFSLQSQKYDDAVTALQVTLADAKELSNKQANESLGTAIAETETIVSKADKTTTKASTYKMLIDANESLKAIVESINQEIGEKLEEAHSNLVQAREQALAKHNLYYGIKETESEIMEVYKESEAYLESNNLDEILAMIDSVNNSYTAASVSCAQKEAELDNLIRKSNPLAVLMEDTEFAEIIKVASECRYRMDGRILAIDSIRPSLKETYDGNSTQYDDAVYELGDSIAEARLLLTKIKDEILQNVITTAEQAFAAAGKTSAASTKYSDLTIQITALAKEMERVRELIEIVTSIDAVNIEDKEVEIYTTQGFLVKRVKLSDNDLLQGIPDGVYIVDGKKVYIHAK